MTLDQVMVLALLAATLALFVHGKLRYDVVALLSLVAAGLVGLVPAESLFSGFGHPAVITVAAVLAISSALVGSGLVDTVARGLGRIGNRPSVLLIALTGLVTACSAFMNNVGALAVFMPVAVRLARKLSFPASQLLMPLAFGSILGGLVTAVGTPPNLIIAEFRARHGGEPFAMFDFAPVGLGAALAGLLVVWLLGRRVLPHRTGQGTREDLFDIDAYLTELRVPKGSPWAGRAVRELGDGVDAAFVIVGLVRGKRRLPVPSPREVLREDDVLIVEADAEGTREVIDATGLELEADADLAARFLTSEDVILQEAVVGPDSRLSGRSAEQLDLRRRHGVNLLAVARRGSRLRKRVQRLALRSGDVLLLQGDARAMPDLLRGLGCLPLAERSLTLVSPRREVLALGIFASAVALAATGVLSIATAFVAAALAMLLTGLLALRDVYDSIDWPIIVLLGAMIPVASALETSGAARRVAELVLVLSAGQSAVVALTLLMVATAALSNVINNAATAVLMAPVALAIATGLGASPDPFLMAVTVAASIAFLTPIGHQSNTLVMGPGGYRFGDYWRLGLPVSVVCLAAALPLILLVWPP